MPRRRGYVDLHHTPPARSAITLARRSRSSSHRRQTSGGMPGTAPGRTKDRNIGYIAEYLTALGLP
jgi:hypothetical protein